MTGYKKALKVLAIGNSFSVDGMEYLYGIAKSEGVDNVILGNLYIGGCSLARHLDNAEHDNKSYEYFKNTDGNWESVKKDATVLEGITDEYWDVITIQQYSGDSGIASSYDVVLDRLIDFIISSRTNNRCRIGWQMTWAYQQGSGHHDFYKYDNDQMTMYRMIVSVLQNRIVGNKNISFIIPSGTAVQNLRTSCIKDNLTRDSFHLNKLGRFVAGLAWYGALSGKPYSELHYIPSEVSLTEIEKKGVVAAVNAALGLPFKVTQSDYI